MAGMLIGLAIVAFTVTTAWVLCRLTSADNDAEHWQRTARAAAATEDAAEMRRQREVAELEALFRAKPRPRNTIPHQTRRTEEDQ
ncbi:hypothetical protein ACFXD5_12130 [Streptomyces sp. NPDC059385]|uniref:hypothetical protein n=1 Tax=Streptomyces sp. NPDC059385 TaxID=3346817 RepID=UPI0036AD9C90